MAKLLPFRSETSVSPGSPRVVDLGDEDADAVFDALSSETARAIYGHLKTEPAVPSDLAAAVDTSLQNVRYHLENLEEAGLIEVVDTWYSSRGNEMSVYAPTDGPIILAGDRSRAERLKGVLAGFVGGVAALIGASLLVQYAVAHLLASTAETAPEPGTETEGGGTADVIATAQRNHSQNGSVMAEAPNQTADAATAGGTESTTLLVGAVPPGALFFLGGLVILIAVTVIWYRRSY